MAFALPALMFQPRVHSASPRKVLALSLAHGLTGFSLLGVAFAASHILATGGVDCASFGVLVLAGPAGALGLMASNAAEKNLG